MIKIKNISKSFGGKVVLKDCSFNVKKNSITTLVGPNGCGKTTLFNIISRTLKLDDGQIIYNKKDITKLKSYNIAKLNISRTFQDPILFKNLTVWQHLRLAVRDNSSFWKNFLQKNNLTKKQKDKINKILKDLKLEDKTKSKPNDLSGGQRKLLDLAIALVSDFDTIMLDEPTAGVAPQLRELIKKIILKLKKQGKTIFIIEHDMNFVMSISDDIIVLDQGKVLTKGKPEEIKNNKKVLEAYLGWIKKNDYRNKKIKQWI